MAACLLCTVLFPRLLAATPTLSVQPVGHAGFDVLADGTVVAPIRLSVNGAITASTVETLPNGLRLSGLQSSDPLAVAFAPDDFVSITLPPDPQTVPEPVVRFHLTLTRFDAARWKALFPDGQAPFHFLTCSMPSAQVWHQRGWLNATPNADPFPLLQDVHVGSPEISCLWNRNWSYLCPLGAHPIPMIGAWNPFTKLYVGYDFQGARSSDQSERYLATAYCWQQGDSHSFITLAYPHGGLRFGEQVYPKGGEVLDSWFHLVVDTDLPSTEDPNERFQTRLFARYADTLPAVPAANDLSWVPGRAKLNDFHGPNGLGLYGTGGETTFYPSNTVLVYGWVGHREMPVDTAVRRGDLASITNARTRLETLLTKYAQVTTNDGDRCVFWTKPLEGSWLATWGGAPVTTLHNADAWFPARVLVELYRYDRSRGQARANYLEAIDGVFNWTKHFVWTRNEFADVPSSPFAIGGTLAAPFLLDYYFTFRTDPVRQANAQLALRMANTVTWRYLQIWAMDSDRFDGAVDSSLLLEPNSGRDWAGLACANEVVWNIDTLTQVYVHTGDPRMRYYLRGILQRWPTLYRPLYEDSLLNYGSDAMTEGLGLFDGAGPGRGNRYSYGFSESFAFNEPIGTSSLRVIAGANACIAFEKNGSGSDVTDYRTTGTGACTFRVASPRPGTFDVSFTYPYVDISRLGVALVRNGQTNDLGSSAVIRPLQAPSSLYIRGVRDGDVLNIGQVPAVNPTLPLVTPRLYDESNPQPKTTGLFTTHPLPATQTLSQDWNDLHSFAGLVPGQHWVHGAVYEQTSRALTNPAPVSSPGSYSVLVAYAPAEDQTLTQSPSLVLDNGVPLTLSRGPALAWRAWPPIYSRVVLLDYAIVPSGRSVQQIDPAGTAVMACTSFHGDATSWAPVQTALAAAGAEFQATETDRQNMLKLRASYAELPAGRVAVIPTPTTSGAGANFAAVTGLRKLWVNLTDQQLIDTNTFNATRFPIALYLGGEHYLKTITTTGDGKTAITRYLAGGGTLILLASEPFPFFYGDGPNGQVGASDALLPSLGLPLANAFEQPTGTLRVQPYSNQAILPSLPGTFNFPPGDQRLRSINRSAINSAHRYTPVLRVVDTAGHDYGDAMGYLELRTGSASGGKILYIWSTLLSSPQGNSIMADAVTWLLNGHLRAPKINSIETLRNAPAVVSFSALPSVDYILEFRDRLDSGSWSILQDYLRATTNRTVRHTNTSPASYRFYRLFSRP